MKKVLLSVLVALFVTVISVPSSYAGIPMNEKSATTVVNSSENEMTINQTQDEAQPVVKKAKESTKAVAGGEKSQLVALILCILVGGLGIHRFYLGYIWQGVVQLLTAGGFGIWWLIDLIRIITGSLGPKDGAYDSTL
jgi:TM2 domain-containing membrane protein YozV